MEIHQYYLFPDLLQITVGNHEGIVRVYVQREAADKAHHAHVPEGRLVHVYALAGALGGTVCRAQDLAPLVQIRTQLRPGPGVVAQGYHVRAGLEYGVRLFGRNAHHVGVFAVYHAEVDIVFLFIIFQPFLDKIKAGLAANVAHGQYFCTHAACPFEYCITVWYCTTFYIQRTIGFEHIITADA
jgi:hypothetical protein